MPDDDFLAKLKAFEGREIAGRVAHDEVNQAMIRHWVHAMGDKNPVYVDEAAAAASVHGEIIAPAVMLQAWTSHGLSRGAAGRSTDGSNEQDTLLNLVESAGFTSVVATNCEQEYDRMLHLGDWLQTRSVIESVSEEKHTGLGVGHFITTRVEYLTLEGEPVGRQLFRILKFKPGTGRGAGSDAPAAEAEAAPRPKRPRPGITPDNSFFFEAALEHRLLIQQCSACQTPRHPPQPRCDRCGSYEWHTLEASGMGTVYSYVVNHHPQVPAFDYPLPIGLVELIEGTRLVAQIVDCPIEDIKIGMAVEVRWIDADDELTVPAFAPAQGAYRVNFELSEEQIAVRDLAAQIFAGSVDVERVKEVEAGAERFDRALWQELADANLLGISLPEEHGGSGLGVVETCLVLQQQGRVVAPVPLWATVVCGALTIAAAGSDAQQAEWLPAVLAGEAVLTGALAEAGVNDPLTPQVRATPDGGGWRLDGFKPSVPAAHVATRVLVPAATPAGVAVFLVDPAGPGVDAERAITTNREIHSHLTFAGAPAEVLGDRAHGARVLAGMVDRALLGLCALQLGVCEAAIEYAAAYTSERMQFGKPLSAFQGAEIRAADAFIDTEAIRVTLLQAAWKLDVGRDASSDVLVAKWWASEGGQRVVHHVQHLHGGMGADIDYPVHRYFLWGKQIEDTLGGASATLSRLGRVLAVERAPASAAMEEAHA